jgi:hypothetical protein
MGPVGLRIAHRHQEKYGSKGVLVACCIEVDGETAPRAEVFPNMTGKSLEERMAATAERIRQLEARKQTLSQAIRQQERKDRTRRLIQIGGIMARLGVDSVEKAQALQQVAEANQEVQTWLRQVTVTETAPDSSENK